MEWVGEWLQSWIPYSDQVTVGYGLRAFVQAAIAIIMCGQCDDKARNKSGAYWVALIAVAMAMFSAVGVYDELIGIVLFLLFGQRGGA